MSPLEFDTLVRRSPADECIAAYVNQTIAAEMAELRAEVRRLRKKLKRVKDRQNAKSSDRVA